MAIPASQPLQFVGDRQLSLAPPPFSTAGIVGISLAAGCLLGFAAGYKTASAIYADDMARYSNHLGLN